MFLFTFEILITILIILLVIYVIQLNKRNKLKEISGPPILPFVGNLFNFRQTPEDIFYDFGILHKKYGKVMQIWVGPLRQYISVCDSRVAEKIMNSSKHIDKMDIYRFGVPWLGYGLLISTGEKWRKRRRILTPAFHFTILAQSIEIFNETSKLLINNLEKHLDGKTFDCYPLIAYYSLDVICEAAMGIKINAQTYPDSKYVQAVRSLCQSIFQRVFSLVEQNDFIFKYFTTNGRIFYKNIQIMHKVTNDVIAERRAALLERAFKNGNSNNDTKAAEFGEKHHMAFLDALLQCRIDGKPLSDADIQEEVDTFMFEGHDTVSSALSFTIYLLANHPEVQEKAYKEIQEIMGDDKSKTPTISDLNDMKYLELVIKESLRLYPPVPFIGRKLTEDLELDKCIIPNDTQISLLIYTMHHDADNFPDPEAFKPERFLQNIPEKNYFAFVPFSAGPRNCIGQKFAMYELKSTISKILRNFELLSAGPKYNLELYFCGILKSKNGTHIRIKPRD